MNKIFLVILAFISINLNAQIEKNAKKFTDEMTTVMELSQEESAELYEMNLNRLKELREIRNENKDMDKDELKKLVQPIQKKYSKELRVMVGNEKMEKWKDYRKEKKAKQ